MHTRYSYLAAHVLYYLRRSETKDPATKLYKRIFAFNSVHKHFNTTPHNTISLFFAFGTFFCHFLRCINCQSKMEWRSWIWILWMEIQFCGAHKCYIHPHFSIYTAITNDIVDAKSLSTHKSTIQLQLQFVYDFFAKYCVGFFPLTSHFIFTGFRFSKFFLFFSFVLFPICTVLLGLLIDKQNLCNSSTCLDHNFICGKKNYMKNSQLG